MGSPRRYPGAHNPVARDSVVPPLPTQTSGPFRHNNRALTSFFVRTPTGQPVGVPTYVNTTTARWQMGHTTPSRPA